MLDRLRDYWERMGQRERRLATIFGAVAGICGILYVGFLIQDGLSDLERHNDDTRAVLISLDARRDELLQAKSKDNEVVAMIGEDPTPLNTYLEKIGGEAGVSIRNAAEKPTLQKGKFHEHSTQISLFDVTLDQLAKFLRGIETQSPIVVTNHLVIKRSSLAKEKFDRIEVTVATYARPRKAAAGTDAAAKPPAAEAKP